LREYGKEDGIEELWKLGKAGLETRRRGGGEGGVFGYIETA
jgi:hypothetical protein